jgi:hypothetical protein
VVEKAKGITTADEDGLGGENGVDGIGVAMDAVEFVAGVDATLDEGADVSVVIVESIRDEEQTTNVAEKVAHLRGEEGNSFRSAEPAASQEQSRGH